MLVSIFGRQSQAYEVHLLVPLVKGAMAMEIFRRLSQLSQFTANAQDPGRIIGMLSQDLNLIKSKLLFLFIGCTAPLFLVASLILLGIRLGWPGILCPLIILVLAPCRRQSADPTAESYGKSTVTRTDVSSSSRKSSKESTSSRCSAGSQYSDGSCSK